MKTIKILLPLTALFVCLNMELSAQVGRCNNVAWNHAKPNGQMAVTVRTYSGAKRLVYGGTKPTIPYKGTLDHHLEQLEFGGNLRVRLRKKGDKAWTEYYGMDFGALSNAHLYGSSHGWKTIDFEAKVTPQWPKGSEIEIYIDNREYGFGFTEAGYNGEVMMIKLGTVEGSGSIRFRSLVVESKDKKCVILDSASNGYSFSTRSIDPVMSLEVKLR